MRKRPDYARIAQLEKELGLARDYAAEYEATARAADDGLFAAVEERHSRARERLLRAEGQPDFEAAKAAFAESFADYQQAQQERRAKGYPDTLAGNRWYSGAQVAEWGL